MTQSTPAVTVCMCAYNAQEYLKEAIDSILNQTFEDFEFVIVDDGSKDKTVEIIRSYSDPRIRLIQNEQNMGIAKSRKRALEAARGEFVAVMDSDDLSAPERLQKQVDYLRQHEQIGLVSGNYMIMTEDSRQVAVTIPNDPVYIAWCLCFTATLQHTVVMFRRELALKVGGYDPDYTREGEDYDLWVRMSPVTQFAVLPDIVGSYRHHQTSYTNQLRQGAHGGNYREGKKYWEMIIGEEISDPTFECIWYKGRGKHRWADIVQAVWYERKLYQAFIRKYRPKGWVHQKIVKQVVNRVLMLLVVAAITKLTSQRLVGLYYKLPESFRHWVYQIRQ